MNKIKRIRKMRGLTQRQLAEQCNISIKSVQAYEQGTRKLEKANINTILKICEVLNCNLIDILNNEYKKPFGNYKLYGCLNERKNYWISEKKIVLLL